MKALNTISRACEKSELSAGTLREYERLGLLKPQRDTVGRRLYSDADIRKARRIRADRLANRGRGLRGSRTQGLAV
jgi:DNA-binding transcriptional MerR regulator